jgi:uncharacterized protein (TIGR03437 family)
VYITGAGGVDNAVATGAPAGSSPLSKHNAVVSASSNGMATEVAFARLSQLNLKVPALAPGT